MPSLRRWGLAAAIAVLGDAALAYRFATIYRQRAGFESLVARPEVTRGGIVGHSMGGVGAILAAASDPRVAALVSISAPSDPRLLVRQTFVIANLPIPGLVAHPLAWYTSRMYLRPRGHSVRSTSAKDGVARYAGPLLIVHGEDDEVMPAVPHAQALADAAQRARRHSPPNDASVELHIVPGGGHGGLYEDVGFRRVVAGFLAEALGGPFSREEAADRAARVDLTSSATAHSSAVEPLSEASARPLPA